MSTEARGRGRGRGARGGASRAGPGGRTDDRPKREAILDLSKYVDKQIRVKFTGGREVTGTLKGFDQLLNLVMDELEETVKDPETGAAVVPPRSRSLGLAVLRGTSLVVISPLDGSQEIANPFQADGSQ
ncbi:hypothetical protein JCM11641_003513 [Rhodosporidiobolus odoratus]